MRSLPHALSWLLATSLAAQSQICQADFNTPVYDSQVSMGGPNLLLAIRTVAPTAYAAERIEVFTGNRLGANTVAIWSHDAINNRPLAQLGSGQWSMSFVRGWQGANLGTPVPLAAAQVFWVVWGCINGAQAPTAGTGIGAQPYRASFDGGLTWNGPFQSQQWKFRIWCGGPPGTYQQYGAPCRGSNGTPRLGWDGVPNLGTSLTVKLQSGAPGVFAFLAVGGSDTTWLGNFLPASLASIGAPGCVAAASVDAWLLLPVDAAGAASGTLTIPTNPVLQGFPFFDQWWILDAVNALGIVTSDAGRGVVGL